MNSDTRNYIPDGQPMYRALIPRFDGTLRAFGPYATIGPAKAAANRRAGSKVQTCTPEWTDVEYERPKRKR